MDFLFLINYTINIWYHHHVCLVQFVNNILLDQRSFWAHLTWRVRWAIVIILHWSSYVNFSQFNLFRNHMAHWNQTYHECLFCGFFWCWSEIQRACLCQKCVLIGRYLKNLLLRNHRADLNVILQKCSIRWSCTSF